MSLVDSILELLNLHRQTMKPPPDGHGAAERHRKYRPRPGFIDQFETQKEMDGTPLCVVPVLFWADPRNKFRWALGGFLKGAKVEREGGWAHNALYGTDSCWEREFSECQAADLRARGGGGC